MAGRCCSDGTASCRLVRPRASAPLSLRTAAASILPGALLVFLPKCPLCLAAWLTIVTGIGFSAAVAAWLRGILTVFSAAAVVLAALAMISKAFATTYRNVRPGEKPRIG